MKHRTPKLLYFSLVQHRISSFWKWVNDNGYKYGKNAMFRQAGVPYAFTHTADLLMFLSQYDDNLQSLHIIIDYESIKEAEDRDIIRNLIIEFPEVQFLFDRQYATNTSVSEFLFPHSDLDEDIKTDRNKETLKNTWKEIDENVDYSLVEIYLRDPQNIYDPKLTFERKSNQKDPLKFMRPKGRKS